MPTEELFGSYNFLLEIQGVINDNKVIVGGFKSVSGMDSETEIVEFKQGNDLVVRKKPGRTTYNNIVLERGYTATDDLWQWRKNIEDGKIDRRAGSIIILTRTARQKSLATTSTKGGLASGMLRSSIDSSEMAIEKIELAIERLRGPDATEDRVRVHPPTRLCRRGRKPAP